MVTVHVENEVHDYDTWRASFDKFEAFRAEQGVRSYRIARSVAEPNRVHVDPRPRHGRGGDRVLRGVAEGLGDAAVAGAARRAPRAGDPRRHGRAHPVAGVTLRRRILRSHA